MRIDTFDKTGAKPGHYVLLDEFELVKSQVELALKIGIVQAFQFDVNGVFQYEQYRRFRLLLIPPNINVFSMPAS